ncbi:universal stress protein [Lacticigenium naphthae]|uniref:universal stress protein n=1 Tax=Lacticigenium naphthae TaxID=515351 RepID=UPI0004221561|nr:universal stress protein [Lacticigenium naphthae]
MLQEYKRILVAIDGSKAADHAFKKAVAVAKRNDSELVIAHVIDTRAYQSFTTFEGGSMQNNAKDEANRTLNEYERYANNHGLEKVKIILEFGSPKSIIAKQLPKQEKVDLIMLGATGLNAVERLFIGSVSEYVIRHAESDVLIVRTDLENEAID